jgi:heavy metal sensor kinase
MFYKSIRFKNTMIFMAVFTSILSFIGYLLYINLEKRTYADIDKFLYASAMSVADSIVKLWESEKESGEFLDTDSKTTFNDAIKKYFSKIIKNWVLTTNQDDVPFLNIRAGIYDSKGNVISSSRRRPVLHIISEKTLKEVIGKKRPYYENIDIMIQSGKHTMRVLTVPIIDNNEILYIIRVAISLNTMDSALTNLKLILFIFVPLIIIISGIFGLVLTNNSLRPVDKIIQTIHQITASNLKLRVNIPESKDEIFKLTNTFNDMVDRLEKNFTAQKQFIEDLSHEIKTPLAILKGQQEVALKKDRTPDEYKNFLISNLEEINRIIQLSENLLLISQFENRVINLNFEKIDLSEIIKSIRNDLWLFLEKKNILFDFNCKNEIIISADIIQIRSLLLNLIDNAIKYNKKGGKITVTAKKDKDHAKIIISDTGIGINKSDLPHVFDRYYRTKKNINKKGYGLGLNIVNSIVKMHRGKIDVKSHPDKGTAFIIQLPFNF